MAAPPPLTWVILARAARRTEDEDVVPCWGGIRIELARPPAVSFIALAEPTASRGLRVDPTVEEGRRFLVAAADKDAGLLVASSSQPGLAPLGPAPSATDLQVLAEDSSTITIRGRFRFDLPLGSLGNLGLMGLPERDGCLVAELQHAAGTSTARLLTFRSDGVQWWTEREVAIPEAALVGQARPWGGDGVFTHDGDMCWLDLRRGILCCDPLQEEPVLAFISLPAPATSSMVLHNAAGDAVRATRCLNLSDGRLTFAEVRRDGAGGMAALVVWVRDGDDWKVHTRRAISEMWATTDIDDDIIPELLFVHPRVPDIIYLLLEGHIMAFDVSKNKLLQMDTAPFASWREVIPWEVPAFVNPDRYPRRSGSIDLLTPDWDMVQLGHVGPRDLLISAQPAGSKTVLHLRLWIGSFNFSELHLKVIKDSGGSSDGEQCLVKIRTSPTDRLMSKMMPLSACLVTVPVPDFECIFKALGLTMGEVRQAPREPTAFTGREVSRGFYAGSDSSWTVKFVEMATPRGPVLLLKFCSPGWSTFVAQMVSSWPRFHYLRIVRHPGAPCYNICFQDAHDSREQLVRGILSAVVRMVPLPVLSEIKDEFTSHS